MEANNDFVAQLTRLGLTSYEAKAYLTLIRRDSFTAAQVARQSGLPRQRIYDVLGSLVQKGLAVARPGSVVKYAATPPDFAVNQLLAAHREDLSRIENDAKAMVADHQQAIQLFEDEARKGQDSDVKAFARRWVKNLTEHLETARKAEKNIK